MKGLGPKAWEQCAGFLRIDGGSNALDATACHPESYSTAQQLLQLVMSGTGSAGEGAGGASSLSGGPAGGEGAGGASSLSGGPAGGEGPSKKKSKKGSQAVSGKRSMGLHMVTAQQLQGARQALAALKSNLEQARQVAGALGVGEPTLVQIVDALCSVGRDVRGLSTLATLRFSQALSMEALEVGMELDGVVRNVTDFGAFTDVNVGQDGLIHISEFRKQQQGAHKRSVHDFVGVGDALRVRVVSVDIQRRRIALTPVMA